MKRRRRKEKKTTKKQKKSEDPPKTTFKNRYSFKRRRMKKIGETRIEYKRDVKHIKISKNIFENQVFFFREESQKNDETFQKRRVSVFQEAEKTQNWRCKKRPQKFKKKKKKSTLVPRRKEKWNKKRHVFFFFFEKMKKTN